MTIVDTAQQYLRALVTELRKLTEEMSWLEFKVDNASPNDIGEYLSALSNGAALDGKAVGYVVWGVEDKSHAVVGTKFKPFQAKKGNENLEPWLLRLLSPRLNFQFFELEYEQKHVVVLEIPRAPDRPVQFQGVEFIRVGSQRQKLKGPSSDRTCTVAHLRYDPIRATHSIGTIGRPKRSRSSGL